MRLRRLDLIRYGKFADATLDFGVVANGTDVTVVYGDNEAGKSTAFTAWLDLLFGLPLQTPHAFRFDRREMMVGAQIDTPDGPLTLRRTGSKNASLTDDAGHTVAEHRLTALLHGLDRAAYRTRFSLDEAVLRDGGEEIARAQGDLGQLLHAGTSGLSGLSDALGEIGKQVDEFHKKGGRATTLAKAKRALADLDAALAKARLDPRQFDALRTAQAEAAAESAALQDALDTAQRARHLRRAADDRRALLVEMDGLKQQLGTQPDDPGLTIAAKLDTLEAATFDDGTSLITRAQGAEADLNDVRSQRDALAAQARKLATDIGGAGCTPPDLILPPAQLDRLQEAAQKARDAQSTVAQLTEAQQEAAEGLGPDIDLPTGLDPLSDALTACDRDTSDPVARAEQAHDLRTTANRTAAGLPDGWRQLPDLPEDAALGALITAADRAAATQTTAQTQLAEAREEQAELRAERDALTDSPDSVSDAQITDSRSAREAEWALHRDALDTKTAQAFEAAMRHDDRLRDHHARSAETRLHLASLTQRLAQSAQRVARRQKDADNAQMQAQAAIKPLATAARALGLPDDTAPATLQPRRAALATARDAALVAETAEVRAQAAKTTRAALMTRLSAAIAAAGDTPDPDRLIAQGTRLRDRLAAQKQAHQARETAAQVRDKLTKRLSDAQRARTKAQEALALETADLWCAGQTPAALLAQLRDIEELRDLDRRRAELDHRVHRMEAAKTAFLAATADIRATLGLDAATPPSDLLTAARQRAQAAKDRADRRARLGTLQEKHRQIGAAFDAAALAAEEAQTDPARADRLRDEAQHAQKARDAALLRQGEAGEALRLALKGTGGAELDQQRATLLEDLRDAARTAAAQMVGLMAAQGALRSFRQDRRGAMLEATERAFSRLTHGEWPRLETQPMGKTERLVALRNGQPVAADAMSTGTRGQLYLALRIAGHADFVARHGALPFVTDDIHETFDDRRATAALELTAEMGRLGQAILFTHHRHLVQLAQDTVPGVRVINLV